MLQHDVHTFYTFQKTIIFNVVKKDLPQIEKVIYFSDGCSGHNKNHKNVSITIATMHYMQNGISLQCPMVQMHVTVSVEELNKCPLIQGCSNQSLDKCYH